MKKRQNRRERRQSYDEYASRRPQFDRDYQDEERPKSLINTQKLFRPSQVRPRSEGQQCYVQAIEDNDIVFGLGPAGVGKSLLAVAKAVESLQTEEFSRIVLVRPNIGLGRTSGFLAGDLNAKLIHFLRPLFDALEKFYAKPQIEKMIRAGVIEPNALEYIRGRTFDNSFVILDEAQNATFEEMQAFLTRLGNNAKYVINGDVTKRPDGGLHQSDLYREQQGALEYYADKFDHLPGIESVTMSTVDIQRHPLVKMMLEEGL